jgi:LDH2 family malate/lactate/ureidoglycolate dehydrogenase
MSNNAGRIPVDRLIDSVAQLFIAAGLTEGAAKAVSSDLVAADVEGVASHGVMLVPLYLKRIAAGSVSLHTAGEVVSTNGATAVIDGRNALGQLTGRQSAALAVELAKKHGLGAVALRNAYHIGALGLYNRMMADQGCFGIVTTNTRPLLPAPGGAEAVTGNNPVAFTAPSSGKFHAEVDMALSAVAMGKIRNAAAAGTDIPDTWATDAGGAPTTDPNAAIAGMLLPAAGPKGFGLAFLLDLMAGGLSEGGIGPEVNGLYGDPAVPYGCAAFFLAIRVGHFTDEAAFRDKTKAALDRTSASKTAPGIDRVFAPGELAANARAQANGTCAVSDAAMKALFEAGQALNVDLSSILTSE